jgi:hypothetical protein
MTAPDDTFAALMARLHSGEDAAVKHQLNRNAQHAFPSVDSIGLVDNYQSKQHLRRLSKILWQ